MNYLDEIAFKLDEILSYTAFIIKTIKKGFAVLTTNPL